MNSLPDMVWSCVFLECPTQLESVVVPQHINTLLAAPVGPESSAASARPTGKRNSTCTMCHLHLSTLYIYIFQRTWLTWFYLYSSYVGDPWDPHVSTYLCLILFSGLPWTSNIKKNDWVHGILLPAIGNEQGIMKRHRRTIKNWWNCPRLTVSSRQTSTLPSDMQPATVQVVECLGCPGAVPVGVESRCSCRIQTQN